MSIKFRKIITILTLAGIMLTPACSNIEKSKGVSGSNGTEIASPTPSIVEGSDVTIEKPSPSSTSSDGRNGEGNQESEENREKDNSIQVITSEEELEEFFNSITDEEIEELFRILEEIDITADIDPEADPGFDQIEIPEE